MSYPLQSDLFSDDDSLLATLPDVAYQPDLVTEPEHWFFDLQSNLDWNPRYQSRLTASFGVGYRDDRGSRIDRDLPDFLMPLIARVSNRFGYVPNNCLVNFYPDGDHYISFHSDHDTDMAVGSGVTILSLGAVREMVLRRIDDQRDRYYYPLQPGSALFMSDASQKIWQHGIPRQRGCGPRISLSFRRITRPGDQ